MYLSSWQFFHCSTSITSLALHRVIRGWCSPRSYGSPYPKEIKRKLNLKLRMSSNFSKSHHEILPQTDFAVHGQRNPLLLVVQIIEDPPVRADNLKLSPVDEENRTWNTEFVNPLLKHPSRKSFTDVKVLDRVIVVGAVHLSDRLPDPTSLEELPAEPSRVLGQRLVDGVGVVAEEVGEDEAALLVVPPGGVDLRLETERLLDCGER